MKAWWVARRWGAWRWWLLAPALVLVLSSWCQLHGSALGEKPVPVHIALPWALEVALGWILAGALMQGLGDRALSSGFAIRHPWTGRALMVAVVVLITMTSETLLVRDARLPIWIYDRLPVHLLFATLWIAGVVWLRSRRPRAAGLAGAETPAAPPPSDVVEVMTGTGHTRVRLADVECLEADRNYINVHTPQRSYLLRQTLSSLEKSLSPVDFLRVHRSTIVNRAKIRERRRGGVLVMSSGRLVRVSRAFVDRVNQRMQ